MGIGRLRMRPSELMRYTVPVMSAESRLDLDELELVERVIEPIASRYTLWIRGGDDGGHSGSYMRRYVMMVPPKK